MQRALLQSPLRLEATDASGLGRENPASVGFEMCGEETCGLLITVGLSEKEAGRMHWLLSASPRDASITG